MDNLETRATLGTQETERGHTTHKKTQHIEL